MSSTPAGKYNLGEDDDEGLPEHLGQTPDGALVNLEDEEEEEIAQALNSDFSSGQRRLHMYEGGRSCSRISESDQGDEDKPEGSGGEEEDSAESESENDLDDGEEEEEEEEEERQHQQDCQHQKASNGIIGDRAIQQDVCSVCYQEDWTEQNKILYCDRCDVPFHQHCYNVPMVPEDDWYCDYCSLVVKGGQKINITGMEPECQLCRQSGGALIRVYQAPIVRQEEEEDGTGSFPFPSPPTFVHKVCAIAGNGTLLDFIAGSNGQIAKFREDYDENHVSQEGQPCNICNGDQGLLIKCQLTGCEKRSHPSCSFNHIRSTLRVSAQPRPMVLSWCSDAHEPNPVVIAPIGSHAVAIKLGLIDDTSKPFGGYLDDKLKLLQKAMVRQAKGRNTKRRKVMMCRMRGGRVYAFPQLGDNEDEDEDEDIAE